MVTEELDTKVDETCEFVSNEINDNTGSSGTPFTKYSSYCFDHEML